MFSAMLKVTAVLGVATAAPIRPPLGAPRPARSAAAAITVTGPCPLLNGGACVTSPNFPASYGDNEACTITVAAGTELEVAAFATEPGYDFLTVNGVGHSGSQLAAGARISPAGARIEWRSDWSVQATGWKLCVTAPPSKIVYGHMANDVETVRWFASEGANGLEADLVFNPDTNAPGDFYHGGSCDCTCEKWRPGSSTGHVCKQMWQRVGGDGCEARGSSTAVLREVAANPQFRVMYIDSKVDRLGRSESALRVAGARVIDHLETALFGAGFDGQVIIGAPSSEYAAYILAAIAGAEGTPHAHRYFFTFDGMDDADVATAINPIKAATTNVVYSTGISACAIGDYESQIRESAALEISGEVSRGGTTIWTLDSETSMAKYIEHGASAIMTNRPANAIAAIHAAGGRLAGPGSLPLHPAARKGAITSVSTARAVGEACSIDSECGNDACGRPTAADGAAKVCCPSGDTTRFGGFDYCTRMPEGATCWSDAQCDSNMVCKGNGGGTQRGTCTRKRNVGESCSIDSDCGNDACGRPTAADGAGKVCCPSGDTTRFGGFDYCTRMPEGATCWSDAQCDGSMVCKGNGGGTQRGTCFRRKAEGEACPSERNADCAGSAGCYRTTRYGDYKCCSQQSYCDWHNPGCTTGYWYCASSGLGR